MQKCKEHGWSRFALMAQIKTGLYEREGSAITNFKETLPAPQSALAQESLKDPYVFDVRHDNWNGITGSASGILGKMYLSQPTYLKPKGRGNNSMLVKQRLERRCRNQSAARLAKQGESYTA